MKKSILALSLVAVFSAPVFANSANTQGFGDKAILSGTYQVIAKKITELDPRAGETFSKYVNGSKKDHATNRKSAYDFVTEVAKSGHADEIYGAMSEIYVKSDGDHFWSEKALNAADSILADAAAHAKNNPSDMQAWKDAGVTNDMINEMSARYNKENWTDIEIAIDKNISAIDAIDSEIQSRTVNLSKVLGSMKKNNVKIGEDGRITENGVTAGQIVSADDDKIVINNNGSTTVIDAKTGDVYVDGWKEGRIIDDTKGPINPVKPDNNNPTLVNASDIAKAAEVEGVKVDERGNVTQNGERIGKVVSTANGKIAISDGNSTAVIDTNTGKVAVDGKDQNVVIVDDSKKPQPEPKPIDPASNVVDEVSKEVDSFINAKEQQANAWARQAQIDFQQEVARLDRKIDTMEGRVSNGAAMVGAMSQMQFGNSGLGVGAGVSEFNGSRAVAVGVGYAFGNEKQWMAKGSFGYAESKKGKGSKDTMAAAGVTYSFK